MTSEQGPFSLAFQILQECPFKCDICHRRSEVGERRLSQQDRFQMMEILKGRGLKRLTVTGGEPMVLGDELFEFLRYVHNNRIHVCLSTTGYKLDRARIEEMDQYVDQLLISIRSLTRSAWRVDYGDSAYTNELFETVLNLLQWIKVTGIILEISTVIHRENIKEVLELGWKLVSLNPNIVWRIEDYYEMGLEVHQKDRFKISIEDSERTENLIQKTFGGLIRQITFSKQEQRKNAPDYFITPTGDLVHTFNNRYSSSQGNILTNQLPKNFKMRRPWDDYKRYCRDWGWGDL